MGQGLSVHEALNFGNPNTYMKYEEYTDGVTHDALQFYVNSGLQAKRSLTLTGDGGYLHGIWNADSAVSTSDRRLKRSIVPLYNAFKDAGPAAPNDAESGNAAAGVGWVLRQLRPVSYKFKSGPEAKYSRYGFVAQELQQVLPSLVRGQGEQHLTVVYQDLIALLTLAAQNLQDKVAQQEGKITQQEDKIDLLTKQLSELSTTLASVAKRLGELEVQPKTPQRDRDYIHT